MHNLKLISTLFSPLLLKRCVLPNRLIRSATHEGMADANGAPLPMLSALYQRLARGGVGTLVTGFCAISREGRAMHPGQGAIWDDTLIMPWKSVVDAVKQENPETRLFMQIAHTGRQTLGRITGRPVMGAGPKACTYFRQKIRPMDAAAIQKAISDFAAAARRARQAGFDGVQIHAAHGYLIHQFLSPHTNTRTDAYGDRGRFLEEVVCAVRIACGPDFPLLLKVSWADDRGLEPDAVISALCRVAGAVDAVEVSYGTMEFALNIIRGDCPIDDLFSVNPLFSGIPGLLQTLWKHLVFPVKRRSFKPFTHGYNLSGARLLQEALSIPVIPVGGIHTPDDMAACLDEGFPALALCRPFIAEPGFPDLLREGRWQGSRCTTCNRCAIYCDSPTPLRCHRARKHKGAES